MVVGGGLVLLAVVLNTVSAYNGMGTWTILQQPALITVPIAFFTVFIMSKATARRRPKELNRIMLRMHAPDPLGFIRDRDIVRFGKADETARLTRGRHRAP